MTVAVLRAAAVVLGFWVAAPPAGAVGLSAADRQFVIAAGNMDNSQTALGRLALQRTSDPAVRRYAKQILADHARIEARLSAVVVPMGLALPIRLDAPIRGELTRLSRLSGPGFDRELIRWELLDFRYHVRQFGDEAAAGTNPQLKRFAREFLPVIEDQYRVAQQLAHRL